MITALLIIVFVAGYVAIAFEHPLKINKAASALITGVLCWTIYILQSDAAHTVSEELLAASFGRDRFHPVLPAGP